MFFFSGFKSLGLRLVLSTVWECRPSMGSATSVTFQWSLRKDSTPQRPAPRRSSTSRSATATRRKSLSPGTWCLASKARSSSTRSRAPPGWDTETCSWPTPHPPTRTTHSKTSTLAQSIVFRWVIYFIVSKIQMWKLKWKY